MNLNLKQAEIVDALKQYVAKQGFSLQGKSVKITFTAGRKDSGLSADVSIEDQDIPGVEEGPAEVIKPVLTAVVTPITAVSNAAVQAEVAVADTAANPIAPADAPFDGGVKADAAVNDAVAVKTTSLFS